ncbi:hypothetical protein AK89_04355 [Enterococcus mundtii CRL35]|nr:hypothetical protein AK89_04355 [Enterococcus mundtii CRL35]
MKIFFKPVGSNQLQIKARRIMNTIMNTMNGKKECLDEWKKIKK